MQEQNQRHSCGAAELNRSVRGGKNLNEPKNWFTSVKLRSLFMCPAETGITEQLTDQIEQWERRKGALSYVDPDGWVCDGKVRKDQGQQTSCPHTKDSDCKILPRKVTLFTLNHDMFSIVIKDWICGKCGFENRYCGYSHGIYPTSRHRLFTV